MVVGIILMAVGGATFLYVAWMFRDSGVVSGAVGVFGIFAELRDWRYGEDAAMIVA
jgi:hypothetical protein